MLKSVKAEWTRKKTKKVIILTYYEDSGLDRFEACNLSYVPCEACVEATTVDGAFTGGLTFFTRHG